MNKTFIDLSLVLVEKICVIIVIAYIITRTPYFNHLLEKKANFFDRFVVTIIFGALSIFGTYSGVPLFGAIANTRDLAPMVAGLVGGPFIGLAAGLIGGTHRYFLGGFTATSCALATVISGLLGGFIYLLNKKEFVGIAWAILFAVFMESFHMLLALLISRPFSLALQVVSEVWIPMTAANAIGVGIFAVIISNLIKEKQTTSQRDRYYAELERKIYEMEKLYRMGLQVSATLDINVVLDLCINTTVDVVGAELGVLFLMDEKKNRLVCGPIAQSTGEKKGEVGTLSGKSSAQIIKRGGWESSKENDCVSWVAENKKSLVINDVQNDSRFSDSLFQEINFKVVSTLCVPLVTKDKVIGVIQICNKKDTYTFNKNDEMLLASFAVHAAIAIENAKFYQEMVEQERIKKELEIAHQLQTSLLPDKPPLIKGYDIAAISLPAKEVGGDFYDFIDIDRGKTGLVIGDVAGKGLPAALFMVLSRSFLRAQAIGNPDAHLVLERTNHLIANDARNGMFVTGLYGILDADKHVLRLSNAGHNPCVIVRAATGECEIMKLDGIALGVLDDYAFAQEEIVLEKGDIVTFYTDGIVESVNNENEQFGMERMIKLLMDNTDSSAQKLVDMIREETESFAVGQPQFDDLTILIVKVL
ncbi:SpoIIE family protein phosphatase [Candidatus Aerophobetes bacterium]|nr:SpoIIE family protein phosphatase [Candidatus Aerophobetes bacterium]